MVRSDAAPPPGIELRTELVPAPEDLEALYGAVGWTAYTDDVARLRRAVGSSFGVATAWSGGRLVGLARILSDGETIAYLQDVLVHPDHRRRGLAAALIEAVMEPVRSVRQQVLLTDAEPGQRAFYEALGFTEVREVPPAGLRAFVRLSPSPG